MKKRVLCLSLAILIIVGITAAIPQRASAETLETASGNVQNRIDQLRKVFNDNSYFTVNNNQCTTHGTYLDGDSCNKCRLQNVMEERLGYSYPAGMTNGNTCVAFARFAFWYIFGQVTNGTTGPPNATYYSSISKAVLGDKIVLTKSTGAMHQGIFLSLSSDQKTVYLYDCNYTSVTKVHYNTAVALSNYSKVEVQHSSEYDNVNTSAPPLPAPTGLTATWESESSAKISWNPVPGGEYSYEAQYNSAISGGWVVEKDHSPKTATSYISTRLGVGNTYQFQVHVVGSPNWATVSYTHTAQPPQKATYTVTFNLDGGTHTGGGALTQTVTSGGAATAPTASRTGYTFNGWDKSLTNITANTTITAQWTQDTILLKAPQNFTAMSGDGKVTLSWSPPVNIGLVDDYCYQLICDKQLGYSFGPLKSDTTNREVVGLTNGESYTFTICIYKSDPRWTKMNYAQSESASVTVTPRTDAYVVTFDPNGGTVLPSSKTVTPGAVYGDLPVPMPPAGMDVVFAGWATALSGGTTVTKDSVVSAASNHTLYAHWKSDGIVRKLTATLILNNTDPTITEGVKLTWPAVEGITYYRVFRADTSGGYTYPLTDFAVNCTTYVDVKHREDRTYYYIVYPLLDEGDALLDLDEVLGEPTNEVSIKTTPTPIESTDSTEPDELNDPDDPDEPDEQEEITRQYILMQIDNPLMNANGIEKEIDPGRGTRPLLRKDRTVLPIGAAVMEMGGTVAWEGVERKVTIEANGNSIVMWIGKMQIMVNGEGFEMDIAPFIENDRTFIPLRFAAQNLNCRVTWINDTKEILIVYS